MAYENFQSVEGIIQSINRGDSCCSMMVSLISNSNIVNVVVTGEDHGSRQCPAASGHADRGVL